MFSVEKYIEQTFPNARYSEVMYLQSATNAAGTATEVVKSFADQAAIAILYHYFYTIGTPEAAGTNMILNDQTNIPLFHFARLTPGSAGIWYPIPKVTQGATVKMIVPINGANLVQFAICFQYLFNAEPKK